MDFTIFKHKQLLKTLISQGFTFIPLIDYLQGQNSHKTVILRHDVEQRHKKALHFAQIQNQLGLKGTYYFRLLPKWFNPKVIKEIHELGHEIGYHYDDLSQCKGDFTKAILRFEQNLKILRNIAPVKTICMDGSPLSPYDNKDLWKIYNYKDYGIIGEPYFDIDFNQFFYLTDTGRRWDGWKVSMRDKLPQQEKWIKQGLVFHSMNDIIQTLKENRLPDQMMITLHPQRWNNKILPWLKELVWQNVKNQGKRILIRVRSMS